ncbi:MAG: hypothetical protein IPJ34_30915 [Myxococcales bacterium]|nr:hypothetical protein [Myxococcales bacterium]
MGQLRRRLTFALGIYAIVTVVFAWIAGDRLNGHTMNNHFAIQAELWKQGQWSMTEEDIAGRHRRREVDMGNDWAVVRKTDPVTHKVEARYFNSFPVFPAVLMYPFVSMAGSALMFRDALFVVALAGLAPALLFLAMERLRDQGRSGRTEKEHAFLALLYAFGTVYFFSSVQGTVWFAAHVVAAVLTGGFLLACFHADKLWACVLAGVLVGCGYHTRPPFLLAAGLFAFEAARASLRDGAVEGEGLIAQLKGAVGRLDKKAVLLRWAAFGVPVLVAIGISFSINKARFGDAGEFGHTLLNVVWMERVKRYGLFSYHYLSRNLHCAFTLLPVINPENAPPHVGRVQFSGMGMAMWVTTPVLLWLLWPKKEQRALQLALWAAALPIALQDLLYHSAGWVSFGYRYTNDFAPYLFVLLAVTGVRFSGLFKAAAAWAVAINLFGAVSFQRKGYEKYYFLQTYSVPVYDGTPSLQSATFAPD